MVDWQGVISYVLSAAVVAILGGAWAWARRKLSLILQTTEEIKRLRTRVKALEEGSSRIKKQLSAHLCNKHGAQPGEQESEQCHDTGN